MEKDPTKQQWLFFSTRPQMYMYVHIYVCICAYSKLYSLCSSKSLRQFSHLYAKQLFVRKITKTSLRLKKFSSEILWKKRRRAISRVGFISDWHIWTYIFIVSYHIEINNNKQKIKMYRYKIFFHGFIIQCKSLKCLINRRLQLFSFHLWLLRIY